jgi:hypothetical protein
MKWIILAAMVCIAATQSPAQTTVQMPERCYVLGQITVSHWLGLLGAIGDAKPDVIDPAVQRLQGSTTLYRDVG